MAFGAETGFPIPREERANHPKRVVMLNAEINDQCSFSKRCGSSCILNQLGSGSRPELSDETWREFVDEVCAYGATVENLAIVGKEPLETPDRLEALLRTYHRSDSANKPLQIGMITSGNRLLHSRDLLVSYPLDWLLISLDAPETGLRTLDHPAKALKAAVAVKKAGGFRELGINTVMHPGNLPGVTAIGEIVMSEDQIDHWALTPMLRVNNGRILTMLDFAELKEMVVRLIHQLGGGSKPILFNLDYEHLIKLIGGQEHLDAPLNFWCAEHSIPNLNVKFVAMNPKPGFFVRLRYNAELVTRREFHGEAGASRRFGHYRGGRLAIAFERMAEDRKLEEFAHASL